ncbi:hypothetical protein HanRHA438_Chr09g0378541 [Helianthus annuus]|nr:hypothetical protein HanRHA438_Chr09g0378541 [Helianthus annuus]
MNMRYMVLAPMAATPTPLFIGGEEVDGAPGGDVGEGELLVFASAVINSFWLSEQWLRIVQIK